MLEFHRRNAGVANPLSRGWAGGPSRMTVMTTPDRTIHPTDAEKAFGAHADSERAGAKEADAKSASARKHQDDLLDEGLKGTFPASDPVSVEKDR